jgi:hypothetical protein
VKETDSTTQKNIRGKREERERREGKMHQQALKCIFLQKVWAAKKMQRIRR